MDIEDLPNLGATSAGWLKAVGIHAKQDLEQTGVIEAYRRCKDAGYNVSLNLLWAMAAGLEGIDWRDLPEEVKEELKKKVENESPT